MIRRPVFILIAASATMALVLGCRNEQSANPVSLTRGGQAYLGQCAVCHGPLGMGDGLLASLIKAEGETPPAVMDSARITKLGRDGLRRAIESGAHLRGGSAMPIWGPHLGSKWIDAIADYLAGMPFTNEAGREAIARYLAPPADTPPSGRRHYVFYCSGCHGPQGGGDGFLSEEIASELKLASLSRDSLARLDDVELAQLIALGGAHAPNAATMPGWLRTLSPADRQELVGYLRAISGKVVREQ